MRMTRMFWQSENTQIVQLMAEQAQIEIDKWKNDKMKQSNHTHIARAAEITAFLNKRKLL